MDIIWHIKNTHQKHKYKNINIGKNSRICLGTSISNCNNVYIGENTYINGGVLHAGKNSKIVIGDNCLISYNVHLRTSSHNYKNKNILIREQGNFEKNIIIGNDVWIGYGVQILPEITVGDGAVLAAGAVVIRDVEKYTVVGGVPARVIGKRE